MIRAASIAIVLLCCGCHFETSRIRTIPTPLVSGYAAPAPAEYHHHFSFAYDDAAHKPDLQLTAIIAGGYAAVSKLGAFAVAALTVPSSPALSEAAAYFVKAPTQAITGVQAK